MIDGFKCSCTNLSAGVWQHNPLLDFGLSVSESTGELLSQRKQAKTGALCFAIYPTYNGSVGCSIAGSLHKHAKENAINWDDFTFSELTQTLDSLTNDYSIDLDKTYIHTLEIGVNIKLDYSPKRIFQSAICHKGRAFCNIDSKNRTLGLICDYTDYTIKLYDKGQQSKLTNKEAYILRYELKLKRQRMLSPYGIKTLADLKDKKRVALLVALLLEKLNEIVFFDFSHPTKGLSTIQKSNWERYSNPKYWEVLNKKQHYTARLQYAKLVIQYGVMDYCKIISKSVLIKYIELLELQADLVGLFPQLFEAIESGFSGTFSTLEYVLEKVILEKQNLPSENLPNLPDEKRRFCATCKRDISHQRKNSRFCSEKEFGKEAKKCRNKDSNRRLKVKRKIYRAMKNDLILRITYTDENGNQFTDTLSVSELAISREWLDRVLRVERLSPQPETLEKQEAKNYLKTITT